MTHARTKPTILLTGCSGLIGRRICRRMGDRFRIVGLDIKPPDGVEDDFSWIECDLTDDASVQQALSDVGLILR